MRVIVSLCRQPDAQRVHEVASLEPPVGTRLDVAQVIDTLRESDNSVEAAAEYLGIPEQHVRAAVRYYADFREEIDEWRERARAIAEREEEAWRREQAIFT